MGLLGTYFTLLLGPGVPLPAKPNIMEMIEHVEVQHSDTGHSGFQIVIRAGRSKFEVLDSLLMFDLTLKPFSRVVMIITFNGFPRVLFDGVILNQQFSPGEGPGEARLTISGKDAGALMDTEKPQSVDHPAQPDIAIVYKILAKYAADGVIPMAIPPPNMDVPLPTQRIPSQQESDWNYLTRMAQRVGYSFHMEPGPAPGFSTAYWGPPKRLSIPQKAITVNMGPETNASGLNFQYDAMAQERVMGMIQDSGLNVPVPIMTFLGLRPPLATMPAYLAQSKTRVQDFREVGLSVAQAFAQAQRMTDESQDRVLKVSGDIDASVYGSILMPWALVGMRGAGYNYDGFYYVQSVKHTMEPGSYKQHFEIVREGLGSTTPLVPAF